VGAILVVAMLIVPGTTAHLWSDRLPVVLVLAVALGAVAAVGGYYLAGWWNSSIAGSMVTVLGALFAGSLLAAPGQGLLARAWQRAALSVRVAADHILLTMVRRGEQDPEDAWRGPQLWQAASHEALVGRLAYRRLRRRGLVSARQGAVVLTEQGRQEGLRLLRGHRLWETYLNELGLPEDHTHGPADAAEHFLDEELTREIDEGIAGRSLDPQGKPIPPAD
jgi:hypothetical protein